MAHAVNETCTVEGLLAHDLREVIGELALVFPVADVLLDLVLHRTHLVVRATVAGALQAANRSRIGGIRIGVGGRKHAAREGRVVTAAMLGMQRHHDVEHARLFGTELTVGTQHGKNRLGGVLTRDEGVDDHRAVVEFRLLGIPGKHHDARQTREQRNRRHHLVAQAAVFRIFRAGIQQQHRTREHIHDVDRDVACNQMLGEAVRQLALLVDGLFKKEQLFTRGQLAAHEKVGDLLETEAAFAKYVLHQVFDIVAAESQMTFNRGFAVIGNDVAVNIRNVRDAGDHARSIGIAQAALDDVRIEIGRIHLVRLLKIGIERCKMISHGSLLKPLRPLRVGAHCTLAR